MSTEEKIYSVYCHTCPDGMQYFGMSGNVKRRWCESTYKRSNTPFKDAIERFGWCAIEHKVLFENLTREEALKIEDSLIKEGLNTGSCLNVRRSGHYQKTDVYKDWKLEYDKTYRETHKCEYKAYYKAYREAHPEECKARKKAWREAHPNYNKDYQRELRKRKKAEKEAQQNKKE